MKRWRFLVLILAVLVLALSSGTVAALMFRRTDPVENRFETAFVDCTVTETFDGSQKSSILVKNTGNIDAYLRVRLVTYWVKIDEDGSTKIVAKTPAPPLEIRPNAGWKSLGDNTYYYETPIAPDHTAPNLLGDPLTLTESEDGCLQVVEVFADAIQSDPGNALDSW